MSKKTKAYFQSFKDDYTKEFPFIKPSRKNVKSAFCEICRCDFAISHAGRYDITRHIDTTKHANNVKANQNCAKLDFFVKEDNQSDVLKAELLFTSFLVEHNVPFAAADHAGPLFRKMFPSCDVAKRYGCARTKTTALVSELAQSKTENMIECLRNRPFAAACDGSNDTNFKLYPIVVTYFDSSECLIQSSLFSIPNLIGDSTGKNISKLIIEEFEKHDIPLENLIAFMADNAAVMQGKKNGVIAFLKEQHSSLIAMGCACHLINLASEKASAVLPVNVDEVLVDIFYYLHKSAKRKETLQKFQNLHNKEAQKIIKHSCTRWLSLGRSLLRLVEQWDPLLSFFKDAIKTKTSKLSPSIASFQIPKKTVSATTSSTGEAEASSCEKKTKIAAPKRKNSDDVTNSSKKQVLMKGEKTEKDVLSREEILFMFLSSETNKAYCLFLLNILPTFDNVNIILQSEEPHIYKLRDIYLELLKELFCRFLKPSAVKSKEICDIDYHKKENQKELCDIVIGHKTMEIVEQLNSAQKEKFLKHVLNFYVVSCDYIINKFPIHNDVLKNAEVANLSKIEVAKFSSLKFFLKLFPCMLKAINGHDNETEKIDELEKEFCSLQMEDLSAILVNEKRMDKQWVEVGKMKNSNGHLKYKNLPQVMLSILLIPHSNAGCERIFSMVKKNRNEFRSTMSNQTLGNLLVLKTNSMKPCYEQDFSPEFLKRAKKATNITKSTSENA